MSKEMGRMVRFKEKVNKCLLRVQLDEPENANAMYATLVAAMQKDKRQKQNESNRTTWQNRQPPASSQRIVSQPLEKRSANMTFRTRQMEVFVGSSTNRTSERPQSDGDSKQL